MKSIDTTGVGEPEAESFRDCQTTRLWQLAKRLTTFLIQVVVSRDYFVLDSLHLTDLKDPRLPVFINVQCQWLITEMYVINYLCYFDYPVTLYANLGPWSIRRTVAEANARRSRPL